MEASPFARQALKKRSLIRRIIKRDPKYNCVIEIRNLLAMGQPRETLTSEIIADIAQRYHVRLGRAFRKEFLEIYSEYLTYCLKDKFLSETELGELQHLKRTLCLRTSDVETVREATVNDIYRESVIQAIADGRLDANERFFLQRLQENLQLPQETATSILKNASERRYQDYLANAIQDERLSPEEEKELDAIPHSLSVQVELEESVRSALEKMKLYWAIENSELPELQVGVRLQRSERCYLTGACEWCENRRVTRRIRYGGPTLRIKIAKGVYWRAGDLGIGTQSEDVLTPIDSGNYYLTNKRVIFVGSKCNKTVRLPKILDIRPFDNGVHIFKETGKPPFLMFRDNMDIFAIMLTRLLDEM